MTLLRQPRHGVEGVFDLPGCQVVQRDIDGVTVLFTSADLLAQRLYAVGVAAASEQPRQQSDGPGRPRGQNVRPFGEGKRLGQRSCGDVAREQTVGGAEIRRQLA